MSHEYLKGSYGLDLEAVRGGASNLPHLTRTLVTSCRRLHRYWLSPRVALWSQTANSEPPAVS